MKDFRIVSEEEFKERILSVLTNMKVKAVTGPGRSGAIAAVYASYILDIPFIPYGRKVAKDLQPLLIIDTAKYSGSTLLKASKLYNDVTTNIIWLYDEPPMVRFWYEF